MWTKGTNNEQENLFRCAEGQLGWKRETVCVYVCMRLCADPLLDPSLFFPNKPSSPPRNHHHHQLTLEQLSGGPGEAYGVQKSRQLKGQNYKDEQLLEEDPQHVDRF